jgi:Protein of unknown function (DUF4239)
MSSRDKAKYNRLVHRERSVDKVASRTLAAALLIGIGRSITHCYGFTTLATHPMSDTALLCPGSLFRLRASWHDGHCRKVDSRTDLKPQLFGVRCSKRGSPSVTSKLYLVSQTSSLQETLDPSGKPESSTAPSSFDVESFIWWLPVVMGIVAFNTYTDTSAAFHHFIDVASGYQWSSVPDGGKYMSDIVQPVLNGPVTFSVSVLLGTLVAMTIGTLSTKQSAIHNLLVSTIEEMHDLELLVDEFPDGLSYKTSLQTILLNFVSTAQSDLANKSFTPTSFQKEKISTMTLLLNRFSQDTEAVNKFPGSSSVVSGIQGSLQRLKDLRTQYLAQYQTTFSVFHYMNIAVLAMTLLFVFLWETDQTVMQYLLKFQLSICWAVLIASYTMLGVLIYDLTTPFSGMFSVMQNELSVLQDIHSIKADLDNDLQTSKRKLK